MNEQNGQIQSNNQLESASFQSIVKQHQNISERLQSHQHHPNDTNLRDSNNKSPIRIKPILGADKRLDECEVLSVGENECIKNLKDIVQNKNQSALNVPDQNKESKNEITPAKSHQSSASAFNDKQTLKKDIYQKGISPTVSQQSSKQKVVVVEEQNLSENSTSHTMQKEQKVQGVYDDQYVEEGYKPLKLYHLDRQSHENVDLTGNSETNPESKLDVFDESSKISPRERGGQHIRHQDFKEPQQRERTSANMMTPGTPSSPNNREKLHFLSNVSRELVGVSRNANKPNMNDYQLVINVNYTQYEVLEDVGTETHMRCSQDDEEDWDIWWIDGPILPTLLFKMKPYQRTNHLPAIYVIARKNLLARNLTNMQNMLPNYYDFFPQTWILPADSKSFKEQFNNKRAKTFIIKPESQCQGKGIFLTRNCDWVVQGEHYVAQRYLHKPYLIDGLKFDLRIYVLVTGVQPLRCFIYKEGLARFATEKYHSPMGSNLNNLCMHLTNYAINKDADGFIQNQNEAQDDVGHKQDKTSDEIWEDIKQICVKTLMVGIHHVAHIYKSSKPQNIENSLCFQILGIDIFLDQQCKSWLIEVNQSPSFMTDSPLDYSVKKNLLRDTIHMLNLTQRRKNKYLNTMKNEMANRLVGKQRMSQSDREALKEKKMRIKDKFENNNLGDFQNLYPLKRGVTVKNDILMDSYDMIYRKAREIYEDSTAGKNSSYRNKNKDQQIEKIEQPIPIVDKKLEIINHSTVNVPKRKKSQMNVHQDNKDHSRRSNLNNHDHLPKQSSKKNNNTATTFKFSQGQCKDLMIQNGKSKDHNLEMMIGSNGKDTNICSSVHLQTTGKKQQPLMPQQNQSQMSLTQQKQSGHGRDNAFTHKEGEQWYTKEGQLQMQQDIVKQMEANINESNRLFMEGVHFQQQKAMMQNNMHLGKKYEMPFKLKHPHVQQQEMISQHLPACNQLLNNEVLSNEFVFSQVQSQNNSKHNSDYKNLRKSNNSQSYGQKSDLQNMIAQQKVNPMVGFDSSQFEVQAPQHSSRTIDPTNFHYSQQQYVHPQPNQNYHRGMPNVSQDVTFSIGPLNFDSGANTASQTGQALGNNSRQNLTKHPTQQYGNLQSSKYYHHSNTASKEGGDESKFLTTPSQNKHQRQSQYFSTNQKKNFQNLDEIQGNPTVLDYIQQSLNNNRNQQQQQQAYVQQQFNAQKCLSDSLELIAQTNINHYSKQQQQQKQQQKQQISKSAQRGHHLKSGSYTSPQNQPSSTGLSEHSSALIQKLGIPITTGKKNKYNHQGLSHKQSQSLLPSNLRQPGIDRNGSSRCLQTQFETHASLQNIEKANNAGAVIQQQKADRKIGTQNSITSRALPPSTGKQSSKSNRQKQAEATAAEQYQMFHNQNFQNIQAEVRNKFPTVNNKSISQKGGIMQIMQQQNVHNLQQQLHLPPHSVQIGPSSKLQQHPLMNSMQQESTANRAFQMVGDGHNSSLMNGPLYLPQNYSKRGTNILTNGKQPSGGGYVPSASLAESGQGIVDGNKGHRGDSLILNKQTKPSVNNQNIFNVNLSHVTRNESHNLQKQSLGAMQNTRSGTGQNVHMPTIIDNKQGGTNKQQHKNFNYQQKLQFAGQQNLMIGEGPQRVGNTQSHDKARPKPPQNDYNSNISMHQNELQNKLDLRQ